MSIIENKLIYYLLKENMYIQVYGKKNCPQCEQAKALLESKSFRYEYIDLGSNIEAMQEARAKGWRSVRQIVVNDLHVGGYKDVVEFLTTENV